VVNTATSCTIKLPLTRLESVQCSNGLDAASLPAVWAPKLLATEPQIQSCLVPRAVDTQIHGTPQHHPTGALPHTICEGSGSVGEDAEQSEEAARLRSWSEACMLATVEPAPHQPVGCSNRSYGWPSPYGPQVFPNYDASCAPNPVYNDGQYGCQCNAEMVERQSAAYGQISAAPALSMDDDNAPTACNLCYASWTPHENNMCERAMIQVPDDHLLPSRYVRVMRSSHSRRSATQRYRGPPYMRPSQLPAWRRHV
jgi:hypothetical protein